MIRILALFCFLIGLIGSTSVAATQADHFDAPEPQDWMIDDAGFTAQWVTVADGKNRFELKNGLVSRTFLIDSPTASTVGLKHAFVDQALLRGVRPEAVVTIDGVQYDVGGLTGQPNQAFLLDSWLQQMKPAPGSLKLVDFQVGKTEPRFAWKKVRPASSTAWPPPGVKLSLEFEPPQNSESTTPDFRVFVHYELYDGIPVFCKWLTVENRSTRALTLDHFKSEILAVVERDSPVEFREGVAIPKPDSIHVETDFAFGGFSSENANRHIVHWRTDPEYSTQVNYLIQTPCLLEVEPNYGPDQTIAPGKSFTSCRSFELLHDSSERKRRSLALRKMYRTIAPWVTENPLMHHLRVADPDAVRAAIDDAAAVGFEMVILSFGSGFNIENDSPEYIEQWKQIADYARSKNVEIGGYSLLSSRKIGGGNDIVPPAGQTVTHGNCPALTSPWGQQYYQRLHHFFESTGFTLLEHDGPYPGDVDVTSRPPLQKGESDSRWVQAQIANDFYRWCRGQGIYLNAPDYYYLNGTNKCGMGYREVNWSLPRAMQRIHTRQNIYDGTWNKTPSMGWMFVPLSEYHGGGAAATIEPLNQHLEHYAQMIDSNLGLGVQACYRGPRLFDSDKTREMVKQKVDWFKKYREILESDVIHGRRADGQDLDWMLHANPKMDQPGMLVVYNPTDQPITKTIRVNLYYSGLKATAIVREQDKNPSEWRLDRSYNIEMPVTVQANAMNWFVIQRGDVRRSAETP